MNNKLLVVEDDPGLQSQIRWCFENYDVLLANDRESAIEQVKKNKPAVVTLDLGLPPHEDNPSEGFATLEQNLKLTLILRSSLLPARKSGRMRLRLLV